jgi:outer membrane protein assembly factor BamD (BamD/ComL family)
MGVQAAAKPRNILLMKHLTTIALLLLAMVAFAGCSAKHKVEMSRLTDGLATASEEVKALANQAVASIRAERYEEAVDTLAQLEDKGLADEHKQAVVDALVDIQTVVTGKGASEELVQKVQEVMMKFM